MIRAFAKAALTHPLPYHMLQRRMFAKQPVTILCYHTLSADHGGPDAWTALKVSDFREQILELRKAYEIVSLDNALRSDGGGPYAVLTFDDGDRGLHEHLLPLLKDDPIPATIYVATGQIESGKPYWFDRVMNVCRGNGRLEVDLGDIGHWIMERTGAPRWRVQSDLHGTLKAVDPAMREHLVDRIEALAPVLPGPTLGPMGVKQLQDLAALPHVTIGAHSHCHNLLDQIPVEEASLSLARNRTLLEEWTGREIRHFAYPNGNHNAALRAMTADMGFASACALDDALAFPGADRFAMSRLAIGRYDDLARFKLKLVGI